MSWFTEEQQKYSVDGFAWYDETYSLSSGLAIHKFINFTCGVILASIGCQINSNFSLKKSLNCVYTSSILKCNLCTSNAKNASGTILNSFWESKLILNYIFEFEIKSQFESIETLPYGLTQVLIDQKGSTNPEIQSTEFLSHWDSEILHRGLLATLQIVYPSLKQSWWRKKIP